MKFIPGKAGSNAPLYRSVNTTWNNASGRLIRAECDKLPDYDKTIRQCDEYPFNSTTSSAGGKLGRFLTSQRILGQDGTLYRDAFNWDPFYVNIQRPSP
ncbi:hypothetical protein [Nonomuraea typhae]|uniref:Uncharacterized protein n=1 Tax=Nonomuraea typhae TaxID=2603600 RepID=A0ABW7YJK9_9ACTN